MQFKRIEPSAPLKDFIECYWIVTSSSSLPVVQKIVPDGFPEIIFHFADSYRINLTGQWEVQGFNLLSGQITRYFYLENQGISDILGIKFKPAAITRLFGFDMSKIVDQVIPISKTHCAVLQEFETVIRKTYSHASRIASCEQFLNELITPTRKILPEMVIDKIISTHGATNVAMLCQQFAIHERKLERLFKKFVGVSPKFYSRIIRFSYIFQVVENKKLSWSEIGLESGFYDQPHFIKNFKRFTGEEPGKYFFEERTLTNFFLKKIVN